MDFLIRERSVSKPFISSFTESGVIVILLFVDYRLLILGGLGLLDLERRFVLCDFIVTCYRVSNCL